MKLSLGQNKKAITEKFCAPYVNYTISWQWGEKNNQTNNRKKKTRKRTMNEKVACLLDPEWCTSHHKRLVLTTTELHVCETHAAYSISSFISLTCKEFMQFKSFFYDLWLTLEGLCKEFEDSKRNTWNTPDTEQITEFHGLNSEAQIIPSLLCLLNRLIISNLCFCCTSLISSSSLRCSRASFSARLRCSFSTFSYFFQ